MNLDLKLAETKQIEHINPERFCHLQKAAETQ